MPFDSVVADKFDNEATHFVSESHQIPNEYMALDIGPRATQEFAKVIEQSRTLLWNGPMGVFEMSNFSTGTKFLKQQKAPMPFLSLEGATVPLQSGNSI